MTQLHLGQPAGGSSAVISNCGRYRYRLERTVDPGNDRTLLWCMLNPSVASATMDDPTIRKVVGFTRRNRFGRAVVVNAYAYRATDPKDLRRAAKSGVDVFGPNNADHIRTLSREFDHCVVAWGANLTDRVHEGRVLSLLQYGPLKLWTLGVHRFPRHPLMLSYQTPLVPWGGRG